MEEHSATPELEDSNTDSSTQSLLQPKVRRRCYPQMSKFHSKGAVLVIVWMYLITATLYMYADLSKETVYGKRVAFMLLVLLCPVFGMIGSFYFSRHKLIQGGLWLMWASSIFFVAVVVGLKSEATSHYSLLVANTVYSIGIGLALMNIVPFGLDQIPDASATQIKAFISRLAWSMLCGVLFTAAVDKIFCHCAKQQSLELTATAIQSFLSATLLTLVLSSNHLLKGWLIIEPRSRIPLGRVYSILKFAVRHKHPVRRSVLVYCEDQRPSRLDLSKSKYGGPFSTEEVEDVKSCVRMALVIATIPIVLLSSAAIYESLLSFLKAEFLPLSEVSKSSCHHYLIRGGYLSILLIILSPPVYELVIYPLFRRWIPGTLKGIGLTLIFPLIGALIPLISSAIWYVKYAKQPNANCMFDSHQLQNSSSPLLPISRYWIEVPMNALTFCFFLSVYVGFMEFICAQAPYNLRSFLLGMFYFMLFLSAGLGTFVYGAWSEKHDVLSHDGAACSVWFYLFLTLVTILGCVLWCCVAKWYKKRERYEPESAHAFVEKYYDRHFGPQRP